MTFIEPMYVATPSEITSSSIVSSDSSAAAGTVAGGAARVDSAASLAVSGKSSHLNLTQAEANRLSARNSVLLTPQMIRYLHTRSAKNPSMNQMTVDQDPISSIGSTSEGFNSSLVSTEIATESSNKAMPSSPSASVEDIVPVRVGYLSKRNTFGFRNWKKYLFVLTRNSLAFQNNDSGRLSSDNLVYIQLRGATIQPTRECRFQILNEGDVSDMSAFYNRELAAESPQSMAAWIHDLEAAIDIANSEADEALLLLNDAGIMSQVAVDDMIPMEIKRRASLLNFNLSNGGGGQQGNNNAMINQVSSFPSLKAWLLALDLPQYEELFVANQYSYEMVMASLISDIIDIIDTTDVDVDVDVDPSLLHTFWMDRWMDWLIDLLVN